MATTVGNAGSYQFQGLFTVIPFKATAQVLTATAGAETTVDITVPGAALGDIVLFSVNADTATASLTGEVTAANTVSITLANATASTVTIASGTVVGFVLQPTAEALTGL